MVHPTNSHEIEGPASQVAPASTAQSNTTNTSVLDFTNTQRLVPEHSTIHRDNGSHLFSPISPSDILRRRSYAEEEGSAPTAARELKDDPVTWMSLPNKGQLAILTLARLAEPIAESGMKAYMFYQLKSFNPDLPSEQISSQGGLLSSCFAAAQFVTATLWGKAADSSRLGRKRVLMIGLLGTLISCFSLGFARSFYQAVLFRTLGGAVNGNVGVMRTMISEIIKERKFQSRAFLLLPMCFNLGVIIGPIVGGYLADPVNSIPALFGHGSIFGGESGVKWMEKFPYALPQLFSISVILIALSGVFFGLDETHPSIKHRPDWGRQIGRKLTRLFARESEYYYSGLDGSDVTVTSRIDLEIARWRPSQQLSNPSDTEKSPKPPFRRIFTPNVVLTLTIQFLLTLHVSLYNTLIFLLLPTPRAPVPQHHTLFRFTGGLGLPSSRVGLATAIIGFIGLSLQLFLYPKLHTKFGTLKCYRMFLLFSPVAYTLTPYLVLLPDITSIIWPCLTAIFALQALSRTFALPSVMILINNSSPDPRVLSTIHGIAQSVSSGGRSLGPLLAGWALGEGLKHNVVGAVWWAMAIAALIGWSISWLVFEGSGNDIKIDRKNTRNGETPTDNRTRREQEKAVEDDTDDDTQDEGQALLASLAENSRDRVVDSAGPRRTAPPGSASNRPECVDRSAAN